LRKTDNILSEKDIRYHRSRARFGLTIRLFWRSLRSRNYTLLKSFNTKKRDKESKTINFPYF